MVVCVDNTHNFKLLTAAWYLIFYCIATYKVLISNLDGDKRESKGEWKCCEGFELVGDSLKGDAFIVAWKQD